LGIKYIGKCWTGGNDARRKKVRKIHNEQNAAPSRAHLDADISFKTYLISGDWVTVSGERMY
jgi:hypothetical protein